MGFKQLLTEANPVINGGSSWPSVKRSVRSCMPMIRHTHACFVLVLYNCYTQSAPCDLVAPASAPPSRRMMQRPLEVVLFYWAVQRLAPLQPVNPAAVGARSGATRGTRS